MIASLPHTLFAFQIRHCIKLGLGNSFAYYVRTWRGMISQEDRSLLHKRLAKRTLPCICAQRCLGVRFPGSFALMLFVVGCGANKSRLNVCFH